MIKNLLVFALFFSLLVLSACEKDDDSSDLDDRLESVLRDAADGQGLSFFQLPASQDFDRIPQDPLNPITTEKVELGQRLYHETGLAIAPRIEAGRLTYSCASCHHSRAGFQAGRRQGIGEGGLGFGLAGEARGPDPNYLIDSIDVQPLRTPTVLNGAYQTNMLWNGQFGATGVNVGTEAQWTEGTPKAVNRLGFEGLETQAIAGLAVHRMDVDREFCETTSYGDMFQAAFGGMQHDDLFTREKAGLAIAAYERTVLANQAPFQKWLAGDKNAMFDEEKEGAILFFGKAKCASCHTGPALNEMDFHALAFPDLLGNGIFGSSPDDGAHLGRGGFTGVAADNHKFKVPQLYNLRDSPFMGHGGSFTSVRDVVEYKNAAVPAKTSVPTEQLASAFVPLGLTSEEIDQLTTFIESALYDANLSRYDPSALPSGFCFPNNDAQTRTDLGCN